MLQNHWAGKKPDPGIKNQLLFVWLETHHNLMSGARAEGNTEAQKPQTQQGKKTQTPLWGLWSIVRHCRTESLPSAVQTPCILPPSANSETTAQIVSESSEPRGSTHTAPAGRGQQAAICSDHTEEVWAATGAREEPLETWVTLLLQLPGCLRQSSCLISSVSLQRLATNCPHLVLPCSANIPGLAALDKTHRGLTETSHSASPRSLNVLIPKKPLVLFSRDHSSCSAGWGLCSRTGEQSRSCKHKHLHQIHPSSYSHEAGTAATRTKGKHWLSHAAPAIEKENEKVSLKCPHTQRCSAVTP